MKTPSNSLTKVAAHTKSPTKKRLNIIFSSLIILALFITALSGCKKDDTTNTTTGYQQLNLVSDTASTGAARIDPLLRNAWGIALSPTGSLWITANHTGVSVIYDRNGLALATPILVPGGAPTGVVYNNSTASATEFTIPGTVLTAKYIFAGEDGTISAWNSGTSATVVADRSALGTVYKGITIARDGLADFIYAANFKGNNIDVYDSSFHFITTKPFDDPTIPAGFAPFNIYSYGGNLYVTYAKLLAPDNEDDDKGPGNGYVNIFTPAGILVSRFASQGTLNSPWGIMAAPDGFGLGSNMMLVGNFGDGRINIFAGDGTYQGQLKDNGTPITIDGLWALQFPQNGVPAGDQNQLFFTAGPFDEEHGLFGYIKAR